MKIIKRLKPDEIRWLARSVIVLVLLAATINVPFALTKMRSHTGAHATNRVMFEDEEAAARGWASNPPHDVEWPDPNHWMKETKFAFREYYISAPKIREDGNNFLMMTQHLGWPLPVIEEREMWWDWDNPAFVGPESNPAPKLLPIGLVFNPLFVGLPIWLLACVLPVCIRLVVRANRDKQGRCVWCGYQIESFDTCPECGSVSSANPTE
ncbi:MAG: hypothetical protein P1U42_06570 [Phycisphaerales bacterium]|nr:hypothetical protein [Phycisphaerales bacterium]